MRVLLTGATGALGRRLLPQLLDAGHEVVGTTRSAEKVDAIQAAGAKGLVMDGLDARSVDAAVEGSAPDAVIHQMTALARMTGNLRRFDAEFADTNRLRTAGTDHLLTASRRVGVERFIAQSYAGWSSSRSGSMVTNEETPLDQTPAKASTRTLSAIKYVEEVVPAADGLVLRYGSFYGPGTGLGKGGAMADMIIDRKFPLVGSAAGRFSFCHIDDAASATVAALDRGGPGVYNVVDDEPAPVAEWLPYLAEVLGAKPPRRLPAWLAKPFIGDFGIIMMTQARGASNAKAKVELGWRPAYPTWRDGFPAEFA